MGSTKLERLQALSESDLRQRIILPLLARMGFRGPMLYHGTREYGKDLIAFDIDRLGKQVYLAVVVKAADLSGSVSDKHGLREVVHQALQCFEKPYVDLYGMTELTMDQVWIATSGRVVPGASESISDYLLKYNVSKLVRIISGSNLVDLLDRHYPSYWAGEEPYDTVLHQRDRLSTFLRSLLIKMGATQFGVDEAIAQIREGEHPPRVSIDSYWTIGGCSSYSVNLEKADRLRIPLFYSNQCGMLRDQFIKARRAVSYGISQLDEVIMHYDETMRAEDPKEFVRLFDKHLAREHPFTRGYFSHDDPSREMEYLEMGLQDLEWFFGRLSELGAVERFSLLASSLWESETELENVVSSYEGERLTIYWTEVAHPIGLQPSFAPPADGMPLFTSGHAMQRPVYSRWSDTTSRRANVADVLEEALESLQKVFVPEDDRE